MGATMSKSVFASLVVIGLLGCGGDAAGPMPSVNPDVFWSLAFQWPAVNLALTAPYDTAQLTAVPRTASGAVLTDTTGVPYAVEYTTKDSAITVSPTGLVTARFASASATIVAQLTVGGITLKDTAVVQVTETPPPAPLATLSIQPRPGGLARAYENINHPEAFVPFYATMATGDPVTDTICTADGCLYPLLVHYASSNPTVAKIDPTGIVTLNNVGRVTLSVSTLAYGVKKVDSLPFSIGYVTQTYTEVRVDKSQNPPALFGSSQDSLPLSVGLSYFVYNRTGQQLEVSVPEASHGVHFVVGGRILPQVKDTFTSDSTVAASRARVQFDSAGTHVLQYRLLNSSTSFSDSVTVLPYP